MAVVAFMKMGNDCRVTNVSTLNQQDFASLKNRFFVFLIEGLGDKGFSVEREPVCFNMPSEQVWHAFILINVSCRSDVSIGEAGNQIPEPTLLPSLL